MKLFPFTKQPDAMDCGPACLNMVAAYYGKRYTLDHLRENCFIGRVGVSLLGMKFFGTKLTSDLHRKNRSFRFVINNIL